MMIEASGRGRDSMYGGEESQDTIEVEPREPGLRVVVAADGGGVSQRLGVRRSISLSTHWLQQR